MKFFTVIFLLACEISNVSAQEDSTYFYLGSLTTGDKNVISYKLEFTVNGQGVFRGFSTYDFYGKNSTKSEIKGALSENGKRISFKETSNVSINEELKDSSLCFVSIQDLRIKKIMNKRIVNGPFIGEFPNGNQCASGVIYLASNIEKELKVFEADSYEYIDSTGRFLLPENLDTVVKNVKYKRVDSLLLTSNPSQSKLKILKKGVDEIIRWPSNIIYLEIWDGSTEDGDIISVYFDDELVQKDIEIKKEKKIFSIPFEADSSILKIEAIDNGKLGINTVNLLFKSNLKAKPYISKLRQGQIVAITFTK